MQGLGLSRSIKPRLATHRDTRMELPLRNVHYHAVGKELHSYLSGGGSPFPSIASTPTTRLEWRELPPQAFPMARTPCSPRRSTRFDGKIENNRHRSRRNGL